MIRNKFATLIAQYHVQNGIYWSFELHFNLLGAVLFAFACINAYGNVLSQYSRQVKSHVFLSSEGECSQQKRHVSYAITYDMNEQKNSANKLNASRFMTRGRCLFDCDIVNVWWFFVLSIFFQCGKVGEKSFENKNAVVRHPICHRFVDIKLMILFVSFARTHRWGFLSVHSEGLSRRIIKRILNALIHAPQIQFRCWHMTMIDIAYWVFLWRFFPPTNQCQ